MFFCSDIPPKNCKGSHGITKSGLYKLRPNNKAGEFVSLCDMSLRGGGWTVILKRMDGTVNFNRSWDDYVMGFGHFGGEFFLGLDNIKHLTENGDMELWVGLQNHETIFPPVTLCSTIRWARYSNFKLEGSNYKLVISGYDKQSTAGDSLSSHNQEEFSTFDKDNDSNSAHNCAATDFSGGWWYHNCLDSNLNGVWRSKGGDGSQIDGIVWSSWTFQKYSLKTAVMAVRVR